MAISAQGLASPRPARVGAAALGRVIARLGVLQIDTVNVFERSHYIPLLSRLGAYDRSLLDSLVHHNVARPRLGRYTEYMAHEATILPVADWPLWAWHRARPERPGFERWASEHRRLINEVRDEVASNGPLRVRDLEHPENVSQGGGWWNKNDVHWAATYLFRRGDLVVVGRQRFERVLADASQVLPDAARSELPKEEAVRELVRRAAVAYGVASLDDLADYPRLKRAEATHAVEALEAAGDVEPVEVDGWSRPAWMPAGQRVPRTVRAAALLSPFDPLVWYRPRAERLFDFHYRISIYTPAEQRQHGYYVMPVLVDDAIVGRVDLKSDRQAGILRVQHAHLEPEQDGRGVELARRVAPLLREAALWQGLDDVVVAPNGTWSGELAATLSA